MRASRAATAYPRIQTPIRTTHLRSFDGTRIAVHEAGTGDRTMVLAPGLGSHLYCWKYFIEHFARSWRLVTWDPRGTYDSDWPADAAHVRLEDHAADLEAIVADRALDGFVLAGWSMGVQIALEYAHRHPDDVRALVLINGAFEHVLNTALGVPGIGPLLEGGLRVLRHANPVLKALAPRLMRHPRFPDLLAGLGFLSGPPPFFPEVLAPFSTNDWRRYFTLMLALNRHSAAPYLAELRMPTLVTGGTKDTLTPAANARRLAASIPGAELVLIQDGTHYAMVEFPSFVNGVVERFLERVLPA